MDLNIGASLEDKVLTIVKSVLSLRQENWVWVDEPAFADVWVADLENGGTAEAALAIEAPCVILITGQDTVPGQKDFHFLLAPPIRASQLVNVFEQALAGLEQRKDRQQEKRAAAQEEARKSAEAARKAAEDEKRAEEQARKAAQKARADEERQKQLTPDEPPPLPDPDHPWAGRNMMLSGKPNFSSFPMTAELAVWLEAMAKQPVSYEVLVANLPMDRELLDSVLNAAAKHGELIDDQGAPLQAVKGKSLLGGLFGKDKK